VAAPKEVKVEMGNGFPAVGAVVDHEAVTGLVEFQLPGDFLGGGEKVAENGVVFRGDGGVAGVVLFGNEKDMDGGLGGDVAKGQDVLVLVDNVGLGFTVDDPFKDRFGHRPSFLPDGQFEELGAEVAGSGPDEMDDLIVEPLAGATPGIGASQRKDAGAETFQTKDGGEGRDLFVHDRGEALEKDHFHRAVFREGG